MEEIMHIFIRIVLVLYLIIAAIATWILFRNPDAEDFPKNAGIFFVGIVPILLALYPYLKIDRKSIQANLVLIYDTHSGEIINGPKGSEYLRRYGTMLSNLDKTEALSSKSYDELFSGKGINIVEKGILEAILFEFHGGWDIENNPREGFNVSSPGTPILTTESIEIPIHEIRASFLSNPYITDPEVFRAPRDYMSLPPESKIVVEGDGNIRKTIKLENPILPVKLHIMASGATPATDGIWGLRDEDLSRYYVIDFYITLSAETKWAQRYPKNIGKYWNWFNNLSSICRSFDWKVIEEKDILRQKRSTLWNEQPSTN